MKEDTHQNSWNVNTMSNEHWGELWDFYVIITSIMGVQDAVHLKLHARVLRHKCDIVATRLAPELVLPHLNK